MRPALGRIGVAAHEAKDHRHGRLERGASAVDVVIPPRERRSSALKRWRGSPASLPRRDHANVRARAVAREIASVMPHAVSSFRRSPRLLDERLVGHAVFVAARGLDPWGEVLRVEGRERELEVREVALHVEEQHGDPIPERLLDEHRHEARLARARHAHDHAMRDEVVGIQVEVPRAAPVTVRRAPMRNVSVTQPFGGNGSFP
jgi:hypothetical protein